MTGTMGVADGRVWVEEVPAHLAPWPLVSLQVNELDRGSVRTAEVHLTPDEVVDLAAQLLATVRPVGRFTAGNTEAAK